MTLRGRSLSTATAVHSPLVTPTRSFADADALQLGAMAALPPLNASNMSNNQSHHNSSLTFQRLKKEPLSVLDHLHAEQKSTIEALTYQIEFYRQREERAKKELDTLRAFATDSGNDDGVRVARLARENRALGDELDALRGKQTAWGDEKRRLERRAHELEQQLQDATQSLAAFTQAVEQLELKMQRRDAEEQTRALEMEQEQRQKEQQCAQLQHECDAMRTQIENMQTAKDENERLRRELQTLSHATTTQRAEAESTTLQMKTEVLDLQQRLRDAESLNRQREATMLELQTKLAQANSDSSSLRVEVEKKAAELQELDQKLQRSTELLDLREKLLTSDASAMQEREAQRHELRQQIATLEREKADLQTELAARERQLQTASKDVEATKSRLMAKDHGVMVATLRSEIAGVKERLRAEFKHEMDSLQAEKAALSREFTALNARLSEKERFIHRLQDEMLQKTSDEQRSAREVSTLKSTIQRLETEVMNAQHRYQQLVDTRSSLAEQLDYGFKELLEDENTARSLTRQVEHLEQELRDTKQQLASAEARRAATVIELEASKQEQEAVTTSLRKKIEELYEGLRTKDEDQLDAKQLEVKLYLLEQEKLTFESTLSSVRNQLENRIQSDEQIPDKLRDTISALKTEKAQQHAKIIAVEDEVAQRDTRIEELLSVLSGRDGELDASAKTIARLRERIDQLQNKLDEAHATVSSNQEEKSKREKKLLRERRVLEEQVAKLVSRIEAASNRNGELGEKIITLMKQIKGYEAEIIAVKTQLKAERHKRTELDRALSSVQRNANQGAESFEDLKRRLHEITSLKESYQGEVHQLKRSIERVQSEKEGLHRQRDEAIKRVSMLMKCQEQMKSTVESHTAELIEEIENVQGQLDDERTRTTVLLANEKTLLRDITDKNSMIARLQQSVTTLQQQQRELTSGVTSALRKPSPRDGRYASFPSTISPTAGGPTTPKTSNSSVVSSSTQELDRLLGNLERISEFSTRSPSASFST